MSFAALIDRERGRLSGNPATQNLLTSKACEIMFETKENPEGLMVIAIR
jgi:hypothetical protein